MMVAFLAFIMMLLHAAPVSAQVSGDLLPDPIGSDWLTRMLRSQVAPSVVEWIEIENAHEAYLDSFGVLQDGELDRYRSFLEKSMSGVPDDQTIRTFIRKLESVRNLIESTDTVLFAEIEEILEESKRDSLVRLRTLRALQRLTVSYGSSRSDRAVPLWSLIDKWERDLAPDQQRLLRPTLVAYENALVPALKAWRKAQDQMLVALADELSRGGIDRIDSPSSDSETMRSFQDALRKARLKTANAAEDVSKLNERLIRTLQDFATPIDHRRIRTAHIQLLTDGRVLADPLRFVSTVERMLAAKDLEDSIRDQVLTVFREYSVVDDRHVRNMLELLEAGSSVDQERLESFDAVRLDLARRSRERLARIATDSQRSDLRIISSSGGLRDRDETVMLSSEDLSIVEQMSAGRGGASHFICRPISRREFVSMVRELAPESWQEAIVDTLYQDYLEAWRVRVEPISVSCDNAQANALRYDPQDPQSVAVDMAQLRESYRLATAATIELQSLDRTFFESLISTCVAGQIQFIERLACARSIEVLLRGTDTLFRPREVAFSRPNIMRELEKLTLSPAESESVSAVLAEFSITMLEAGLAARDIRMEVEFENHRLNYEMSRRIAEENAMSADYGAAFRDLSGRMATLHGVAMQRWFDSESAFREAIRSALSQENRFLLDESWKRASNPMVYRTGDDAGATLRRASELQDLSDDQSVALEQVLMDHQSEWNSISDEMASINELLRGYGALSEVDSYETWRVLEQKFSRLEFERREVDLRALRRLALYLNDRQRKGFPSLQDFESSSDD